MHLRSLAMCSSLLLAFPLVLDGARAQQFVGFDANMTPSATSRGGVLAAGTALARIDAGDYAGWATDPAFPGLRVITGIDCIVQDQDAVATPEVFGVTIYPEDPLAPGFPLMAAGVAGAAFVPGPPPPAAGLVNAAYTAVAFGAPIVMPAGSDVFIGLAFPAAPAFPVDGVSFQVTLGYAAGPAFPTFDLPGATMAPLGPPNLPTNSYALYTAIGGVPFYALRRQILTDIDSTAPGGVVGAITAQASFPISGVAPGTASLMSALHPDVTAPPFNPGRADNISYMLLDAAATPFSLVFFLANLGGAFGPEMPLVMFGPGSRGVTCIALGPNMLNIGVGLLVGGSASQVILIPAAVRPMLAGLVIIQQAVTIDAVTGALRAGPCGRQKM